MRWRKVKTVASKSSGVKVILAQNLDDEMELPKKIAVKKVPKGVFSNDDHAHYWCKLVQSALALGGWGSPLLVTYYGVWQDDDNIYIVMDYVCKSDGDGQVSDLYTAVATGLLPWKKKNQIAAVKQMLLALELLDCKGVPHPHLRLQSFLVSSSDSIQLACLIPTSCAAPATNGDPRRRAVYQFGAVLHSLLFGRPPLPSTCLPSSTAEATAADFVARLLHPDPSSCPCIRIALKHPWLAQVSDYPALDCDIVADCATGHTSEHHWEAVNLALGGQ
jgi:serine/threonine protein kinase